MNQTVRPYEIILVDNASSDGSLEIARHFSDVKLIAVDQNAGFARGNNIAIKEVSAESEWIALINPDAFAEPQWLEQLILAAQRNPKFDIFASKLLNAENTSLLDGAGDAYHMSGKIWRVGRGAPAFKKSERACEVFSSCAAAALYRRSAMLEANCFDEDFFCYVEDVDLGFRLRLLGYRCLYVPESVAYHIGAATTGRRSDFSVYHGHRNIVWSYVKNMPGFLFWLLLPIHILLNIVTIARFISIGKGKIILRSKMDAIKGLPKVWIKRKHIQSGRIASVWDIWRIIDKRIFPLIKL